MPKSAQEVFLEKIQSEDPAVRTEAWQQAGDVGAPAIRPLAAVVVTGELEVSRAAKRALWRIVRTAGHPDSAEKDKQDVIAQLLALLPDGQPAAIRREAVWMLSEIAGDQAVAPLADLLNQKELREDARMALDRIPGQTSLSALQAALEKTNGDFKFNLAQSLRHRGVEVEGLPCRKLVPTRKTKVEST